MTEIDALLTEAEKLARLADQLGDEFASALRGILRDVERELRVLALDAIDGSSTALSRAVRAAKLRKQVQDVLKAAGYEDLARAATSGALDRLLAQVERLRLAAALDAFTVSDFTRITALQALAEQDLLGQGLVIARVLWRALARGLVSQRTTPDLLEDLAEALDVSHHEARTLYDTTTSVFARQVEALKARPDDVYAYLGPADVKLRPFCRARVGKVFTREEIDAMDNGQLPNAYLTGGGYQCRHSWVAVSKVSALRNLVGTDQRMPEVEAQLARTPVGSRRAA